MVLPCVDVCEKLTLKKICCVGGGKVVVLFRFLVDLGL